jgi:hypothetical protein
MTAWMTESLMAEMVRMVANVMAETVRITACKYDIKDYC